MNCWEVLQIPPTDDVVVVKKAYATAIKITRPESDALGFQKIRAAYEQAMLLIRTKQLNAPTYPITNAANERHSIVTEYLLEELQPAGNPFPQGTNYDPQQKLNNGSSVSPHTVRFQDFLTSSFDATAKDASIDVFSELFKMEQSWDINESLLHSRIALEFVQKRIDQYGDFPEALLAALNNLFEWSWNGQLIRERNQTLLQIERILNRPIQRAQLKRKRKRLTRFTAVVVAIFGYPMGFFVLDHQYDVVAMFGVCSLFFGPSLFRLYRELAQEEGQCSSRYDPMDIVLSARMLSAQKRLRRAQLEAALFWLFLVVILDLIKHYLLH